MKFLRQLAALIQKAMSAVSVVLLICMVILMFTQVMLRITVSSSIIWSEEALRFMFIWLVFLGVSSAIYYNDLSRFDLIQEKFGPLGSKILGTVIYLITGGVLYIAAIGAIPLIKRQMAQFATAVPIKMGVIYMIIPICAYVSLFYIFLHILFMWLGQSDLSHRHEDMEAI